MDRFEEDESAQQSWRERFASKFKPSVGRASLTNGPSEVECAHAIQRLLMREKARAEFANSASRHAQSGNDELENRDVPPGLAENSRFRVIRTLSKGDPGDTYVVIESHKRRTLVLKTFHGVDIDNAEFAKFFDREIRPVAQLTHPNIAALFDCCQLEGLFVLVLEYVRGADLREIVMEAGPLPVALALNYIGQAARALGYAHDQGVIHGRVRPHELMVTDFQHNDSRTSFQPAGARVRVINFGMAAYILESHKWTGQDAIWGNLAFTTPESMRAPSIFDRRGDIFSLGCTLYFLLTGERPFPNKPYELAEKGIPATPLNEIAPWIDKECVRVVHKMIARDVEHRYQDCAEVVKALERCSACEPIDSQAKRWWKFW